MIPTSSGPFMALAIISLVSMSEAAKAEKCEVCVGVIKKLSAALTSDEASDFNKIEAKLGAMCLDMKKQENRFCYYLGSLPESATKIVNELSKPLSYGLPADKICDRLSKKDSQICELKYEVQIDLKTVDLKKLRVKDLKKILSDWDERCDNCIEKAEFITKIEEVKPKYVREEL